MWVNIAGLCFNLLGVLIISIPTTRILSWPVIGWVGNSRKLKEAKRQLLSEGRIYRNSEYFGVLLPILREQYGEFDIEGSMNAITAGNRYGIGNVIALSDRENTNDEEENFEIIGPLTLIDSWIDSKIERVFLKWGLVFVALGFILQLISII